MPTIEISTAPLPLPRRRAIALRLTRWLSMQGVTSAHVIVRFVEVGAGAVFTGGLPVEALSGGQGTTHHASVTCCISPDRDDHFRAALAAEVARALDMAGPGSFLYLEFRSTPSSQVYLAGSGGLRRADDTPTVPTEEIGP